MGLSPHTRLWAIFLGRSTCLRNSDVSRQVYPNLSSHFQVDHSQVLTNSENNIYTRCFDLLIELLEISANVVELLYSKPSLFQHSDYLFTLAGLDAGLKTWYKQLPDSLAWTEHNAENASLAFFHLQYVLPHDCHLMDGLSPRGINVLHKHL